MSTDLPETFRLNHRINLFLLDHIPDTGMTATLSTRGGRDVARQFGHLHDVRIMMLEVLGKDLLTGLKKFGGKDAPKVSPSKAALVKAHTASTEAIATLLQRGVDNGGKLKGYKRGVVTFLGYLLAHEGHHRGSIILTLKQTGHKLPTEVQYGIWEWEKI